MQDARRKIGQWQIDYNEFRPHDLTAVWAIKLPRSFVKPEKKTGTFNEVKKGKMAVRFQMFQTRKIVSRLGREFGGTSLQPLIQELCKPIPGNRSSLKGDLTGSPSIRHSEWPDFAQFLRQ
jgi:hypothetical protein